MERVTMLISNFNQQTVNFKHCVTKTFEFFEFAHLITNSNIKFLIKLWLVGNKEMQYLFTLMVPIKS